MAVMICTRDETGQRRYLSSLPGKVWGARDEAATVSRDHAVNELVPAFSPSTQARIWVEEERTDEIIWTQKCELELLTARRGSAHAQRWVETLWRFRDEGINKDCAASMLYGMQSMAFCYGEHALFNELNLLAQLISPVR